MRFRHQAGRLTIIRRQAYDFTVKPKSYLGQSKKMGRNVLWFEINMLTLQPVLALLELCLARRRKSRRLNCPCGHWGRAGHIHNGKGVSCALVLTHENFATSSVSQKQGNENALWECIISFPSSFLLAFVCQEVDGRNYIYTRTWGFQRCSFRLTGQCEGLHAWDE